MLIFDEKNLAVSPETYQAIISIPGIEKVEILDALLIGKHITFLAYIMEANYSGLCLIETMSRNELPRFLSKMPTSSQMRSLKDHVPEIIRYYNQNTDVNVAVVLKIPGLQKDKSKLLKNVVGSSVFPYGEILQHVNLLIDLISNWNTTGDILRRIQFFSPLDALEKCLLIQDKFPKKILNIDFTHTNIVIDNNISLPNPIAYINSASLWDNVSSVPLPLGRINGNLYLENVLVREDAPSKGPILLNWEDWEADNYCPFIDYATLELDLLCRIMPSIDSDISGEWIPFLDKVMCNIYPLKIENGIYSIIASNIIEPIRRKVKDIIDACQEADVNLTSAYWISCFSAGLQLFNKQNLSINEKIIGLIYSSFSLRNLNPSLKFRSNSVDLKIGTLNEFPVDFYSPVKVGSALLIGVGEYDYPLRPIPAAIDDILSVSKVLSTIGYNGRITHLANSNANLSNVRSSLDMIKPYIEENKENVFFLYFSCHGIYSEGEYYLLLFNSSLNDLKNTALTINELVAWLSNLKSERRILVFDCCHSGETLNNLLMNLPDEEIDQIAGGGNIIITSSEANQKSYIFPSHTNSLFTTCFIEALSGNTINPNDKTISIFDVFNYTANEVRKRAAKAGWRQSPRLGANINRCFPVGFLKRD